MSMTLKPDESLVTAGTAIKLYQQFLRSINTPVALGVFLRLKYGEFSQIATMSINPGDYTHPSRFQLDYQAVSGLKKAAFLETGIDKRKAALDSFLDAEKKCKDTNQRFDDLMYGNGAQALLANNPKIFGALERAAKLIKRILGPIPSKFDFRFGPGVTSCVKRFVTTPKKYMSNLDVSPELYDFALSIAGPNWTSYVGAPQKVPGSRIDFVPKDCKTDRTIAIEPHLNGYVQLGIGSHLRDRFRPWVDLKFGQEINRFLASQAHSWRLATVDLKSASDTIARSLVWHLLPEEWAQLLDTCRSHRYQIGKDETWVEFEKFSSMGCGFTFELESIIFYALSRAVGSNRVLTAVYGDDIIVEEHLFDDLKEVLEYCGFTINGTKSFCRSAFFESCGADFFHGVNVRPFLWKELSPTFAYKMANDISRFSRLSYGRDAAYHKVFKSICAQIPKEMMLLIPCGVGDVGVIEDFDVALPYVRRLPNGWCGFSYKALNHRPDLLNHSTHVGGLLSALDRPVYESARGVRILPDLPASRTPIRNSGIYQICRTTSFGEWSGYGPWI
jgi:hypothetical protein